MIDQKRIFKFIVYILMLVVAVACTQKQDKQLTDTNLEEEIDQLHAYGICIDSLTLNQYEIQNGNYLSSILMDLGFTGSDAE